MRSTTEPGSAAGGPAAPTRSTRNTENWVVTRERHDNSASAEPLTRDQEMHRRIWAAGDYGEVVTGNDNLKGPKGDVTITAAS